MEQDRRDKVRAPGEDWGRAAEGKRSARAKGAAKAADKEWGVARAVAVRVGQLPARVRVAAWVAAHAEYKQIEKRRNKAAGGTTCQVEIEQALLEWGP